MKHYQYEESGLLIDPEGYTPQPNPVSPENPLIRPNSTELAPPTTGQNQVVTFADGQWTKRGDYRGTRYWMPDGSEHEITQLDFAPPPGHLTAPPPPTTEQRREQERGWASSELSLTDRTLLPDSRYSAEDQTKITTYRHALRNPQRDATANYPEQSWRPTWPEGVKRPD